MKKKKKLIFLSYLFHSNPLAEPNEQTNQNSVLPLSVQVLKKLYSLLGQNMTYCANTIAEN